MKGRVSPYELFYSLSFALRISYNGKDHEIVSSALNKNSIVNKWLHPDLTMEKVQASYGSIDELK